MISRVLVISLLAHTAFADDADMVEASHARQAISESPFRRRNARLPPRAVVIGGALALICALLLAAARNL